MTLPADQHVHTEWSWDARDGAMERTCARAVRIGLPAIAFTEHADYTPWVFPPVEPGTHPYLERYVGPDGILRAEKP